MENWIYWYFGSFGGLWGSGMFTKFYILVNRQIYSLHFSKAERERDGRRANLERWWLGAEKSLKPVCTRRPDSATYKHRFDHPWLFQTFLKVHIFHILVRQSITIHIKRNRFREILFVALVIQFQFRFQSSKINVGWIEIDRNTSAAF